MTFCIYSVNGMKYIVIFEIIEIYFLFMWEPHACQQGLRILSLCVSTSFKFLESCPFSHHRRRQQGWMTMENTAPPVSFHGSPRFSHKTPPNFQVFGKCRSYLSLMPIPLQLYETCSLGDSLSRDPWKPWCLSSWMLIIGFL